VLAEVARVLGDNDVSIRSVWQEGTGEDARLIFVTHRAREGSFQRAATNIRELAAVEELSSILRVEAEE
jgi:homoserine dehydrogenase